MLISSTKEPTENDRNRVQTEASKLVVFIRWLISLTDVPSELPTFCSFPKESEICGLLCKRADINFKSKCVIDWGIETSTDVALKGYIPILLSFIDINGRFSYKFYDSRNCYIDGGLTFSRCLLTRNSDPSVGTSRWLYNNHKNIQTFITPNWSNNVEITTNNNLLIDDRSETSKPICLTLVWFHWHSISLKVLRFQRNTSQSTRN